VKKGGAKEWNWKKIKVDIVVGVAIVIISTVLIGFYNIFSFHTPSSDSNIAPKDLQDKILSLYVENDVRYDIRINVLNKLRESEKLRQLANIENDKLIEELPIKTYFFISVVYLNFTPFNKDLSYFDKIKKKPVSVHPWRPDLDFEIHFISENDLFLIGFISADYIPMASKLDGKEKDIMIFPSPWGSAQTLIKIPINRVISARMREINGDNTSSYMLDLKLK